MTSSTSTRDVVITRWMPLAKWCANQYDPADEDVRQVAYMGLIKAVDAFDSTMGAAFSTYATHRIRSEIRRHYRDTVWTVRPPRPLQRDPEVQARCRYAAPLPDPAPADDPGYRRAEDRAVVVPILAAMRPDARRALLLRFGADLTQEQIGRQMGCSQMQVSRLITQALKEAA